MRSRHWTRAVMPASLVAVIAAVLAGCGGGGGGGGGSSAIGSRSYASASGGQTVSLSVDASSRFTIYVQNGSTLAAGVGAQGTVGSNGQFVGLSDDGTTQFSGALASDGSTASGTVQRNGANIATFTAAAVAPSRGTSSGLVGSFLGSSGDASALLTLDTTSHATLWARAGSIVGGGLVTVQADGTFQTDDGQTTGQFVQSGSTYTLTVSKLAGTTVSASMPVGKQTRAKWTFMVFLNAANNLSEFGPLNVNQMEKVGSTHDVNMVVQWKQATCYDCGTPDWVSTRRYYVTKDSDPGTVHSLLLQDMGPNIDMGDWHELRNFVLWAQQRYPADHYALVIWDHGAGWRNTRSPSNRLIPVAPRSVSIDDSTSHEIQTWELPQALNVTPALDLVVFDASLMQMTEVAYEIRSSAQYVVGSEESPPGEGYVYDTFLSDLVANPNMGAAQLGTQIVNRTLESYGTDNNLTQSLVDLSKMSNVATKLSAFADSLQTHAADSGSAETNARNNSQNYVYPENKDLWDYAELIRTGTSAADLKSAAVAVQQAIGTAVVAERHGTINGRSHGLAIYVPAPTNYLATYANLSLARVTDWPRWLQNQP